MPKNTIHPTYEKNRHRKLTKHANWLEKWKIQVEVPEWYFGVGKFTSKQYFSNIFVIEYNISNFVGIEDVSENALKASYN